MKTLRLTQEAEHGGWQEFRMGLSKEDQQAFDRLFDRAKFYIVALAEC
jgi:hypothetical protein